MDKGDVIRATRWFALAAILGCLVPVGGCRICADCEDMAYPAYGGAWQRTRRSSGRVGSLFDPAGGKAAKLTDRDDPDDISEMERMRQQDDDDSGGIDRSDESDDEPSTDDPEEQDRRQDDLQDRRLDDIRPKNEEELRRKELDDINVRIVPGQPLPPLLQ